MDRGVSFWNVKKGRSSWLDDGVVGEVVFEIEWSMCKEDIIHTGFLWYSIYSTIVLTNNTSARPRGRGGGEEEGRRGGCFFHIYKLRHIHASSSKNRCRHTRDACRS